MKVLSGALSFFTVASLFALLGCATPHPTTQRSLAPDQEDAIGGSFIESSDIRTCAARVTAGLLGLPAIASSAKPTLVALAPMVNSTSHVIDQELLLMRLRLELNNASQGRITFVAQNAGQRVRRDIIAAQDEAALNATLDELTRAVLNSDAIKNADQPVKLAVIPILNPSLAGLSPDFLTALLQPRIQNASGGKAQFLAREANGKIIEPILGESDLKSVGLVIAKEKGFAGVDYFLGGELISESMLEQAPSTAAPGITPAESAETAVKRSPNVRKHLNLMLIDAASGAVVLQKPVVIERKMDSGLAKAKYILTGELRGLSKAAGGGDRSDYTIISFQLVHPESNGIVWEYGYETKRQTDRSVIYK